jgi:DNA-binding transcriptional regulator YiaG
MSQQGDAFVRRVLKADPAPMTFGQSVQYLRQREGSGRAAARRLGVSESSLRRWDRGTKPKAATQQKVMETVRRLRSRPSTMGDAGVMLPVVSQDRRRGSRERDVSGVQLKLRPGTLQRAHETWLKTGNADAAAAVFVKGIGDPWYRAQLAKGLDRSQQETGTSSASSASTGEGDEEDEGDDITGVDFDEDYDIGDDYGMSIG